MARFPYLAMTRPSSRATSRLASSQDTATNGSAPRFERSESAPCSSHPLRTIGCGIRHGSSRVSTMPSAMGEGSASSSYPCSAVSLPSRTSARYVPQWVEVRGRSWTVVLMVG